MRNGREKKRSSFRRNAGRILRVSERSGRSVIRMRRPDQPALSDAATGRVSMPFLPTLAVVALLGMASLYCPSSSPPTARDTRVQLDPLTTASLAADPVAAAPSPTAFAPMASSVAVPSRMPASLAFAEAYPFDGPAPKAPAVHAGPPARSLPRLAVANRRACPGHRCPETPQRGADPFAAAHAEAAVPAEDVSIPRPALPFADTVAETLAPAARIVGDATDLMRSGAAAMRSSVSVAVADCLR